MGTAPGGVYFVVPLCANVHMVGSAIKLMTSAYAIGIIYGVDLPVAQVANFIFMMAIAAVAALGVMGGVVRGHWQRTVNNFVERKERIVLKILIVGCLLMVVANVTAEVAKDVPYAISERCRLDVKWPNGATNFPTVVWFHGGGLTRGGKNFIRIDKSIAQVSVDYRLLGRDVITDGAECIRDAAAAVAWTLENIAKYGGDPKKVYVSGMSAGGYLTMMVGMAPQYLKERGHDIRELAGLAPISGQATKHFNVRKFAGDTDPQYLPKIDALAPLAYCSKDIPPIISICGEEPWEWKCRSEENRLLISSCVALGHDKAWFVSCPFADHGRAFTAGVPYVEMFVQGRMPTALRIK